MARSIRAISTVPARTASQNLRALNMNRGLKFVTVGVLGATLIVAPWSWLHAQERAAFPISRTGRRVRPAAATASPRPFSLRDLFDKDPAYVMWPQDEEPGGLSLPEPSSDSPDDDDWQLDEQDSDDEKNSAAIESDEWIVGDTPVELLAGVDFDLPSLIALAQQNSPTLRKLRATIDQAEGLRFQATRLPNPTFGYFANEVGNDGAAGQHGLFWSQTWIRGGKLGIAGEVAGWEVERRRWQLEVGQHRVANLVREAYYNLLAARRSETMAQRIVGIAERNLKTVEELFEAGEVAKNSVLQAKVESQRFELQSRNATIKRQRAERLLAIAAANPQMDFSTIIGDILGTAPELTVDEVVTWLDEASPELEVARSEIERTRWRIQQEEARPISNVNTQFSAMYDDSTGDPSANVQVSWQVPRHNKNCGNIDAAQADSRRAQAEYEELLLNLKRRVQRAFTQYDLAKQQVLSFEQNMLPMAEENLKITQEAYKVGEATYQTLLTAQRSYFDTALSLIEARRLLWLAVARIQGLVIPE